MAAVFSNTDTLTPARASAHADSVNIQDASVSCYAAEWIMRPSLHTSRRFSSLIIGQLWYEVKNGRHTSVNDRAGRFS